MWKIVADLKISTQYCITIEYVLANRKDLIEQTKKKWLKIRQQNIPFLFSTSSA